MKMSDVHCVHSPKILNKLFNFLEDYSRLKWFFQNDGDDRAIIFLGSYDPHSAVWVRKNAIQAFQVGLHIIYVPQHNIMWIFLKAQTIPNYKPHYESMTDSGQCNVSWFKKFLQGMPRIIFFATMVVWLVCQITTWKIKRTPCVPRRVICRSLLRQLRVVRKIVRSHLIQLTISAGVVAFMWSRFGIKFDSKQNQYSNL